MQSYMYLIFIMILFGGDICIYICDVFHANIYIYIYIYIYSMYFFIITKTLS